MTKRDFFRIIIKLFALYSAIIAIFSLIPSYLSYALNQFDLTTVILVLGSLTIVIGLLFALIFGADKIIKVLKLDKGFDDERIEFGNLRETNILKLATIIIGGLLIIDNFPVFLLQTYLAFKNEIKSGGSDGMLDALTYERVDYFKLVVSSISILIGYLMITNYTRVTKWISNADKKNIQQ
ncbi:MAG: hypothetical protein V7724_18420 [Sediminicola sp.]